MFFVAATFSTPYNITTNIPEVIQVREGRAYLYNEEWKVIHTTNFHDVFIQGTYLMTQLTKIKNYCKNHVNCTMTDNISLTERQLQLIERKKDHFMPSRHKRGIFNFMGAGYKFLFGTLDNSDAEFYNREINGIYNQSNQLLKLVKNQTMLVKNNIKGINEHLYLVHKNFDLIQKWSDKKDRTINHLIANQKILISLQELELAITEYNEQINNIQNAISLAKTGVVLPAIVSPTSFINALNELKRMENINNLIEFTTEHFYDLIKISNIVAYLHNDRLIFVINTPIPEDTKYDIIKLHLLPVRQSKTTFKIISLKLDTLIVTQDRMYYTFKNNECIHFKNDEKICKRTKPLMNLEKEQACYSDILTAKTTCNCHYGLFQHTEDYVGEIYNMNSWLIMPKEKLIFHVWCKNLHNLLVIESDTLLRSNDTSCAFINDKFQLKPFRSELFNAPVEYLRFNITPNVSLDKEYLDKLELAKLNDNLESNYVKLSKVQESINRFKFQERAKTWVDQFYQYLDYVGKTIIAISIMYALYKCGAFNALTVIVKSFWNRLCCCKINYINNASVIHAPHAPSYVATYSTNNAAATRSLLRSKDNM